MKKIIKFSSVLSLALPLSVFAENVEGILSKGNNILGKYIIPMLITLAVVYFIWGVIQYTVSQDEEAKSGARGKIIQGLIGLFVIVSFWGIVRLFSNTLSLGDDASQLKKTDIPCVPPYC